MEKLGLNSALVAACRNVHIKKLTEIQIKSIPLILNKKDVVGIAPTGSGKTACYCLPTLQMLSEDSYGIFALVLIPTKELALQVFEQFVAFAAVLGLRDGCTLIVGGADWLSQSQALARKPYVVVATPGRLLHLIETREVKRSFLHTAVLVLDEADKLLSGTLVTEVEQICNSLPVPGKRQTLLFTATMTPEVTLYSQQLGRLRYEKTEPASNVSEVPELYLPVVVNVNPTESPLLNLQQFYLFIPARVKTLYLVNLLQTLFEGQPGIIFTKTCQTAQLLTTTLELYDFPVTCLHSMLDHRRRSAHLAKFRGSLSTLLVATDVVSRGLDIPKVNFVIHFDFPGTYVDYVHRVGRTARVGRKGVAVSLISEKDDSESVLEVEKRMDLKLELLEVDDDVVNARLTEVTKKQLEAKQILYEAGFFDRVAERKAIKLGSRLSSLKNKRGRHLKP